GGVAAAGPAWQRDEPAYLDNVAPLIVALDLSASMDGADVPPTRLEAARRVLRDLAARRAAARTGLIAYAGSAQALATGLIERPGRDADGAIALAAQALAAE
ncbi:VWA domain-containing protein, partial [Bordetella pertussis]|uniref:VWA domain-containing protein n=1 Tax=Bordetella pertussis TaxID=520 RepID=UPI000B283686